MDIMRGQPRRLVLAFSVAVVPQPAIDSAAELARLMGASLLGLFVEDSGLFAAASLPFVRELDASLRAWRPLSHAQLSEDYAAAAAVLRRQLLLSAAVSGVQADFAVFRGDPDALVAAGTAPTDLVAHFESIAASPQRQRRAAAGTVFVPRQAKPTRGPVIVLDGGGDDPAIKVASRIAEGAKLEMIVIDAVQEHSSAFWLARTASRGVGLTAPLSGSTIGKQFLRSGLPSASFVILARATLQRLEARLLSIAALRPEPWLVLENA